jgi:uncharacterized membrane protein
MRSLRIVLAVSILLNVFLIAAAAGGAIWLHSRPRIIAAGSLRFLGDDFPPAERRAFMRGLRETRRTLRPTALDARQARSDAADQLRQPKLDEAALSAALERLRNDEIKIRAAIEARAVNLSAALPLTERQKLADAVDHPAEVRRRLRWWPF